MLFSLSNHKREWVTWHALQGTGLQQKPTDVYDDVKQPGTEHWHWDKMIRRGNQETSQLDCCKTVIHWVKWRRRNPLSHNDIYVVGQHGVLCKVKWRRFVALFRENWISWFKKMSVLSLSLVVVVVTDHFSGPGRAIGSVCVGVSVLRANI